MALNTAREKLRINARKTDVFDLFNFKFYEGPNPYLETGAFVFDFTFTGQDDLRPLDQYVSAIADRYPQLLNENYPSHAHLFARTVVEVGKLDMDLYCDRWSLKLEPSFARIAVQAIHARTSREAVYCVWDWFEAINQGEDAALSDQIGRLQKLFHQSVYHGPTIYSLIKTAYEQGIPTFYLWNERLMQYGYGKKQVRGFATTFDRDSHLDSDFTTRKDDCKAFLHTLGFPVPKGKIVISFEEAQTAALRIGYPVAVKPVVGHKGIGVTADVKTKDELKVAFERAVQAIAPDQSVRVIIEESIAGQDFRLLCVNNRFVAATERRPASVTGDGFSTIQQLIEQENRTPARTDTSTSSLSKIQSDQAMELYLQEQGLAPNSVLEPDRTVYLRKVANLSAGGLSIDATRLIHPDNIILAQDVAQHFRLTCLGIDVIARDLSESWKTGGLRIIEINAAPGVFMHLKPAIGESVDVTSPILKAFFNSKAEARIPIISFNRISVPELQEIIDSILLRHSDWTVGAVCHNAVFVNRSQKSLQQDYNTNIQNLLRHPQLDLLIAEYREDILENDGMFYFGSDVVILDRPTAVEMMLARDVFENSTVVVREANTISIQREGLIEQYPLGVDEPFSRVYLKEIATIL
jgi:cyanophycin synthetase